MKTIKKRNVFITGGAKRIGAEISKALSKLDFNIVVHYNTSVSEAKDLKKRLNKSKANIYLVKADLTNEKQVIEAFKKAQKQIGSIDCLINNASVFEYDNIKSLTAKSWNKHMSANLNAPLMLSKLFYHQLPRVITGDIINIIDQRVLNLTPHFLSYTASKSGLWTMTQTLALELAPRIKVNAIGPGPVIKSKFQSNKDFMKQCKSVPLQIGSSPDEIARTIIFILSMPSITGQIITLDGGQHLGWGQVNNKSKLKD